MTWQTGTDSWDLRSTQVVNVSSMGQGEANVDAWEMPQSSLATEPNGRLSNSTSVSLARKLLWPVQLTQRYKRLCTTSGHSRFRYPVCCMFRTEVNHERQAACERSESQCYSATFDSLNLQSKHCKSGQIPFNELIEIPPPRDHLQLTTLCQFYLQSSPQYRLCCCYRTSQDSAGCRVRPTTHLSATLESRGSI
jgi:hypothetical protein